jgi:hypothetical protein
MEAEKVEQPIDFSTTTSEEEKVEQPIDFSTTTSEEEKVEQPIDFGSTTSEAENNEDDILLSTKTTSITEPVDESQMEETDSTSTVADNVENPVDFSSTSMVTDNVDKPIDFSSTSLEQQPTEDLTTIKSDTVPNKKELINSLSAVVDYITDAVAEKVSQKIPIQPNEDQQDGFDSVNTAAGMMAKIGGKRRKTRKFKLTKKNKTKKA